MERQEIIEKLETFKKLLKAWSKLSYNSTNVSNIRSEINKQKPFVQKVVIKAGVLKLFDIGPPPMIGGFVMRNVNPFDVLFDPPYDVDVSGAILDSIDQAIGIIEADESFSLDNSRVDSVNSKKKVKNNKKVFLVHGHDNELKQTVARFIESIDLKPIILHEQASSGLTIIEKFEKNSDVGFAIILMSPDDVGNSKDASNKLNYRARQNVVFELGYFFGRLGRENIAAIIKGNIERPSDYDGIVYINYDNFDGWKMLLAKELKEAGIVFDGNKVF